MRVFNKQRQRGIPANKSIIPQRPYYSTKRKRQIFNIRIAKPTTEQRKEIFSTIMEGKFKIPQEYVRKLKVKTVCNFLSLNKVPMHNQHACPLKHIFRSFPSSVHKREYSLNVFSHITYHSQRTIERYSR